MKDIFPKGITSRIILVYLRKTDGTPYTGLVYNTPGLQAYYKRDIASALVAVALVDIATPGTYVSGGFREVSAANAPGLYEVHLPDAMLAAGADSAVLAISGASGTLDDLDPNNSEFKLETPLDLSNLDAAISTRATPADLANLDAPVSGCATPADLPSVPTAQENATAVVNEIVEDNGAGTTWTLKAALRLLMAFMVGERSGGGTITKGFKTPGGTKIRVAMQTDEVGNSLAAHTLDAGDAL